jgi:hypothetical protein
VPCAPICSGRINNASSDRCWNARACAFGVAGTCAGRPWIRISEVHVQWRGNLSRAPYLHVELRNRAVEHCQAVGRHTEPSAELSSFASGLHNNMRDREESRPTLVAPGSSGCAVRLFAQEENMRLLIIGGLLALAFRRRRRLQTPTTYFAQVLRRRSSASASGGTTTPMRPQGRFSPDIGASGFTGRFLGQRAQPQRRYDTRRPKLRDSGVPMRIGASPVIRSSKSLAYRH